MSNPIILTATEARKNFFHLLSEVAKGREAFILKKDTGLRFRITVAMSDRTSSPEIRSKEWDSLSAKIPRPKALRRIILEGRNR